jgi:two-component sensor histidine kinase
MPAAGAYWVRIAIASSIGAIVATSLLATPASGRFITVFQHALVHSSIMGALAGSTLPWLARRLRRRRLAARALVLMLALLGLAVAGTWAACGVITALGLDPGRTFWMCFTSDLRINALLTGTIAFGMMLYAGQRAELATVALEARLSSLEARLHPHFLFNTLNAISALIPEDPDLAERTVERLAALLRFSLDATKRGTVSLAEELRIVTDYLEIEKARLGQRLAYAVDVAPDVAGCEVPPLAVQTLVENSVKHAIAPRPSGGRIRVEARMHGDRIDVAVWDDGPGFTESAMVDGHGLENLQGRLAARFGGRATLSVGRRDGGSLVTVSLPLVSSPRGVPA